jgi:hypothetical protein
MKDGIENELLTKLILIDFKKSINKTAISNNSLIIQILCQLTTTLIKSKNLPENVKLIKPPSLKAMRYFYFLKFVNFV